MIDAIAGFCLIVGSLLSLSAGVALLRFPDLLSRMHAATKPQVLGLVLVLTGCALRFQDHLGVMLLVAVFQMATAPVAAHMVGRAGYRSGRVRQDLLITDELAEASNDDPPRPAAPSPGAPGAPGRAPGAPGISGASGPDREHDAPMNGAHPAAPR